MKKMWIVTCSVAILAACTSKEKEIQTTKSAALEQQNLVTHIKDSLRLDSFKKADSLTKMAALKKSERADVNNNTSNYKSGSSSKNTSYAGNTATTTAAKKEGWSDAAKGATIGGVAGAVGGAIIDKKKGRGAVIGGVLGAGTGYLIGRDQDKKTGRVKPKN